MSQQENNLTDIPKVFSFSAGRGALSKKALRKGIWIFVILCAVTLLSYQLATVIVEYDKYLVNTVLIQHMYGFLFPNITICKRDPFSTTENQPPEGGFGIRRAMRFWKFALNLTDSIEDEDICYKKAMSAFQEYIQQRSTQTSLLNEFHLCRFMDRPCNLEDFYLLDANSYFNCIIFAPKERRLVMGGKHNGLQLILSSENSNYKIHSILDKFNRKEGYNIIVHENRGDVLEVEPWSQATVRLKMRNYSRVDTPNAACYDQHFWVSKIQDLIRVHFPPEEYGECKLVNSLTEAECLNAKLMLVGLKRCRCVPNSMTVPMHCDVRYMKSCHSLPREFFYNDRIDENGTLHFRDRSISLENSAQFREIMERVTCHDKNISLTIDQAYSVLKSSCPKRCLGVSYDATINSNKWPKSIDNMFHMLARYEAELGFIQNRFDARSRYGNKSFASIIVYPQSLNVEETDEELAYPISKLISDFGGSIGLWIGCSFLTLVELFEVLINLTVHHIQRKNRFVNNNNIRLRSDPATLEFDSPQ